VTPDLVSAAISLSSFASLLVSMAPKRRTPKVLRVSSGFDEIERVGLVRVCVRARGTQNDACAIDRAA
jgi:hypothetical protein